MTELEVRTKTSYEDEYIEFVRIKQGNTERNLKERIYEDKALVTRESGSLDSEFGDAYLPEGCHLDLEVVTPRPDISVEVSTDEVKNNGVEYATWSFGSTRSFENWMDKNNIKVRER